MIRALVSPLRLALVTAAALAAACATPTPLDLGDPGDQCATVAECKLGLLCEDGICKLSTPNCEPKSTRCADNTVVRCDDHGQEEAVVEVCEHQCKEGACSVDLCIPGKYKCEGDEIVVCSEDAQSLQPVETCARGCTEATESGGPECNPAICRAGATRCGGAALLETCDSRGLEWVPTDCTDGGVEALCESNGASGAEQVAFCKLLTCTPGVVRCAGSAIVQCNADGSGESAVLACEYGCKADATCKEPTCVPDSYRCSPDGAFVEICNQLGTGFSRQRCDLSGAGRCVEANGAGPAARCITTTCSPSEKRCDGDKVVQCDPLGELTAVAETCAFGCVAGECAEPACAAGERQCGGANDANLELCAPDRRSFVFDQFCVAGCAADASASGGARCEPTICSPFFARCTADSRGVQTCGADGLTWTSAVPCGENSVCRNGSCTAEAPQCLLGARRCNAGDLEGCATVENIDSFVKDGSCLGQCSGTACDAAGECGAITLHVANVTATEELPADGRSTFLVYSKQLTGPNGVAVPDGTMVTVAVESSAEGGLPARVDSGDADADAPGLQIPVLNGRIDFVIRAPQLALDPADVLLRAQVGSHRPCSGVATLRFAPNPTGSAADTIFHAEDFSTLRNRDPGSALSDWNTKTGTLYVSKFDAGDGRDGVLTVPVGRGSGDPYNLTTEVRAGTAFPDGYQAYVRDVGAAGDRIAVEGSEGFTPFAQPGTRILLMNVRGEVGRASSVGAWELVVSAGVADGMILLERPLTRTFGVGGNSATALAGQVVRAVRVPQYSRVLIDGVLTAAAFDAAGTGGILAFFAASTDTGPLGNVVTGTITMDSKGYRGAPAGDGGYGNPACNAGSGPTVAGIPATCGNYVSQVCAGATSTTGSFGVATNCTNRGNAPLPVTPKDASVEPRSGEGPEGRWGAVTYAKGYGTSGGGTCCGSGNVGMPIAGANPVGVPNTPAYAVFGAGGSYGSPGNSSCGGESGEGAADIYGDSLLHHMFMGAGSGSISVSSSQTCAVTRACLRKSTGGCCSQPTVNYHPDDNSEYPNPAPRISPIIAVNECNAQAVYSYCDARADLFAHTQTGKPGGGIVWITAANLDLAATGARIQANGEVNTNGTWGLNGFGSAGGSIYLRAGRLTLGTNGATRKILAQGGAGGGAGRIRLDVGAVVEPAFEADWTGPDATVIPITSDQVSSTIVIDVTDDPDSRPFEKATVFVLPAAVDATTDGEGNIDREASYVASAIELRVTSDNSVSQPGAPNDGEVIFSEASIPPLRGQKVRWFVRPAPAASRGGTRGLALRMLRMPAPVP